LFFKELDKRIRYIQPFQTLLYVKQLVFLVAPVAWILDFNVS